MPDNCTFTREESASFDRFLDEETLCFETKIRAYTRSCWPEGKLENALAPRFLRLRVSKARLLFRAGDGTGREAGQERTFFFSRFSTFP